MSGWEARAIPTTQFSRRSEGATGSGISMGTRRERSRSGGVSMAPPAFVHPRTAGWRLAFGPAATMMPALMKSLVTGGTGFVGKRLVAALRARGDAVRVLALPKDPGVPAVEKLGAEIVTGSLLDAEGVKKAVAGCDRIFHLAAMADFWAPRKQLLYDVNVVGTRNVLAAGIAAGAKRAVVTSSANAIGQKKGEVGREDTKHRGTY